MLSQWIRAALDMGFTSAAPLDISTIEPMESVREMCAAKTITYTACVLF